MEKAKLSLYCAQNPLLVAEPFVRCMVIESTRKTDYFSKMCKFYFKHFKTHLDYTTLFNFDPSSKLWDVP